MSTNLDFYFDMTMYNCFEISNFFCVKCSLDNVDKQIIQR